MNQINYHGHSQSWTKWLGVALGGIFAVIAIGSGLLILRLTRSPTAAPVAALAAAPLPGAAPAAAAAPVMAAPQPATPAPASPPPIAEVKHHSRHHERIAAAPAKKSAPAREPDAAVVAKHDNKEKRQEKDALDKLLGM